MKKLDDFTADDVLNELDGLRASGGVSVAAADGSGRNIGGDVTVYWNGEELTVVLESSDGQHATAEARLTKIKRL